MNSAPGVPIASIIILTYNGLEYTRLCLDSVIEKTSGLEYELILVDNASGDETPEYLQQFAAEHDQVKLILNPENVGFSAGNNIGARAASGQFLVFLNNDVVVTHGWLSRLLAHLDDPQVGMVGPVTNASGNESRILVPYDGMIGMESFAREYTQERQGQAFEIPVLALYCVALRREVFEQVGPLDERFGYGMFEDDDYSLRLKRAGYRLLCAEDVFIHHWGSAGFSSQAFKRYWNTFIENRQKYEDKWGVEWIPHSYRKELHTQQLKDLQQDKIYLARLIIEREQEINDLHLRLIDIHNSTTYKLVRVVMKFTSLLFPAGSGQNRLIKSLFSRLISILRTVRSRLRHPERERTQGPSAQGSGTVSLPFDRQLRSILEEHKDARDVIVIAPTIAWDATLFQRPQQLALAFARLGCLVFYCELPHGQVPSPTFNPVAENIYVYDQPDLDVFTLIPSPVVITLPYNRKDLQSFDRPRVVYEIIDELDVFHGELRELKRNHDELIASSDVVLATADVLYQRVHKLRPDAILVPNGVDIEFFRRGLAEIGPPPDDIARFVEQNMPIIGYYGAMANWFNYNLVIQSAKAFPELHFVFIGYDMDSSVQAIEKAALPNLHWLGPRPHREIPAYLKYFDVATIPFRLNKVTHSTSPLKLFEYMSAGKPILTTAMHECTKYPGVLIAHNEEEYFEKLRQALDLRDDPAYRQNLLETAAQNTWDARVKDILNALDQANS